MVLKLLMSTSSTHFDRRLKQKKATAVKAAIKKCHLVPSRMSLSRQPKDTLKSQLYQRDWADKPLKVQLLRE
jgi:hypothetical protein